jgi:hypothetical protein
VSVQVSDGGPYGGQIYVVSDVADLSALPDEARKLVSIYQEEMLADFPAALGRVAESAPLDALRAWIEGLQMASACQMEICLTEYASPRVFLRYTVSESWSPALTFEALGDRLAYGTPPLLEAVQTLIGGVNLDGYGFAGGLLCPADRHPVLERYYAWREEGLTDVDLEGTMAFYETFAGDLLLVDREGRTAWYVHDDLDATGRYGKLETTLEEVFEAFAAGGPFLPR